MPPPPRLRRGRSPPGRRRGPGSDRLGWDLRAAPGGTGGRPETAARLRALGAVEDGTEVDRFLGACLNADRPAVERLLADHPDLPGLLTNEDRAVICQAAESRPAGTLALMLEFGFPPNARRFGERPLHAAAYHGNATAVRVLLEAGAEVDARDEQFESTALTFATVGSGERAGKPGDWTGTVRLLIEAGASTHDVWVTGKPPSEEVADLLTHHGIGHAEPAGSQPEPQGEDEDDVPRGHPARSAPASWPRSPGTWKPPPVTVTWTCSARCCTRSPLDGAVQGPRPGARLVSRRAGRGNRGHRPQRGGRSRRRGARLDVARVREGARPAPPQPLYQVFTVHDGQIVEIQATPTGRRPVPRRRPGRTITDDGKTRCPALAAGHRAVFGRLAERDVVDLDPGAGARCPIARVDRHRPRLVPLRLSLKVSPGAESGCDRHVLRTGADGDGAADRAGGGADHGDRAAVEVRHVGLGAVRGEFHRARIGAAATVPVTVPVAVSMMDTELPWQSAT